MKKIICFCSMIMIILVGLILSSCCSPDKCEVKVTFVNADEELLLENYNYKVEFNEPTQIQFTIPEGFDHTKVVTTISDTVQEAEVEFEEEVAEEYYYSIGKTLTYKIQSVKRDFEIIIDMTEMPKLQFDVNLDSKLNNFKVVTVEDETLERLTMLNKNNITSEIKFIKQKASIDYGENILLIHTQTSTDRSKYDTLYSELNHFTEDKNKANIGVVDYSFYNVSKKGNTRYYFDGDGYTSIYYIGEIKEDINIYPEIPAYEKDKGFEVERLPNVFYLFTNLSEYNSDYCTIETYTSTDAIYNSSDNALDKIGDVVIKKTTPNSIYNDRYDLHNVYVGDNFANDNLLTPIQKNDINKDLYIKIKSTIDLENLNIKLLAYEREAVANGYELDVDLVSVRGEKFLKLTKDIMLEYSIERSVFDASQNVRTYNSGSAILYVELDNNHFNQDRANLEFNYSRIWLEEVILNSETEATIDDFHLAVYIKDGNKKDYGLIDYHYEGYSSFPRDCVYFQTSRLFNENNLYRKNLYVEIRGKEYQNYKTITIRHINFYVGQLSLTPFEPAYVEDPKVYNGYKDFALNIEKKSTLSEYLVKVELSISDKLNQATSIDFSQLALPEKQGEMVYVTNNVSFTNVANFETISYINKATFNNAYLSCNYDLYYFVRCTTDKNFDFDIYLDPDDPSTKVSAAKYLCDITGERLTLEINGEPFNVMVLMQDSIYETLDGKLYAVKK